MLPHNTHGCAGKSCLNFELMFSNLSRKIDILIPFQDDAPSVSLQPA
jgi:hypothetical protein